jgi:hypothetical protein
MRGTVAKRLRRMAEAIKGTHDQVVLEKVKGYRKPIFVEVDDEANPGKKKMNIDEYIFYPRKISLDCTRGSYLYMKRQYKEAKRG